MSWSGSATDVSDYELKGWFLECLKTIKKEVAQRKNYASKGLQIEAVKSLEEFKMIDKLRLLEMFLQNEKLLVWMYQKIFPSRMDEINKYLSAN
jgi:hypothetical protein